MNYAEAKELKGKIGDKIIHKGVEFEVYISPSRKGKFKEYLDKFTDNEKTFKDETSKLYAIYNDFVCCGLGYINEVLIYKILTEKDISINKH